MKPDYHVWFLGVKQLSLQYASQAAYPSTYNRKNQTCGGSAPAPRKGQKHKEQKSKIPGDTKTQVEVGTIGVDPETESRPQALWTEVPRTAPNHSDSAITSILFQPRRAIFRRIVVILMPAIYCPFQYVTGGIKKPKRIGLKRTHRRGLLPIPLTTTITAIRIVFADVIASPIAHLRTCSRSVFPFRFGRQSIFFT